MKSISKFNCSGLHPEPESLAAFVELAYSELRGIAAHYFKGERRNQTLQPTALVNEVFLRLERNGPKRYPSRAYFFAVAARTMRQILVEAARKRGAEKRGKGWQQIPLEDVHVASPEVPDYQAIDSALKRLTDVDPQLGQVAELRVFASLSLQETATVLGMSLATVRRRWDLARTWLQRDLRDAVI